MIAKRRRPTRRRTSNKTLKMHQLKPETKAYVWYHRKTTLNVYSSFYECVSRSERQMQKILTYMHVQCSCKHTVFSIECKHVCICACMVCNI